MISTFPPTPLWSPPVYYLSLSFNKENMNEFLGVQLDEAGPDLINFISKLEQGAIDTVGWSWSTTDWFTFTCLQINIKTCEKVSPMLCVHLIDVVTNPSDLSAISK